MSLRSRLCGRIASCRLASRSTIQIVACSPGRSERFFGALPPSMTRSLAPVLVCFSVTLCASGRGFLLGILLVFLRRPPEERGARDGF